MTIRILIADDHDVVRQGLRTILESHPGWKVVAEAGDGKDAIKMALQTKPDVAVLDYSMPLINGVEATRQIRERLPKTDPDLLQLCRGSPHYRTVESWRTSLCPQNGLAVQFNQRGRGPWFSQAILYQQGLRGAARRLRSAVDRGKIHAP